jgi:hypothetical protein
MSQDNKVIGFMSPGELAALMRETGLMSVDGMSTLDGQPVIQAALKIMNSRTGEELPGGLPFAVVLFKGAGEPGYTNIAIGTSVPVAELGIALPPDFFNRCNQGYRFLRAYGLDRTSFVLQMDLFLRGATREYVKFGFGLWAAGFSQILFDLFGQREDESFAPAVEAYAASQESVLARYATAVASAAPAPEALEPLPSETAAEIPPAEETATPVEPQPEETAWTPPAEEPLLLEPLPDQPADMNMEQGWQVPQDREEPSA